MFNWDQDRSSKKLVIEDDQLTIKVKDGSGFKTSLGDQVGTISHIYASISKMRIVLIYSVITKS